jgi:hypothetical protein
MFETYYTLGVEFPRDHFSHCTKMEWVLLMCGAVAEVIKIELLLSLQRQALGLI